MDVTITSFTNPFSFYCRPVDDNGQNIGLLKNVEPNMFPNKELNNFLRTGTKKSLLNLNHGQYVAVMLNNEWTRGVITMESQLLIWLIDQGKYLRPDDRTVYVNLPSEFKKCPTKVFEASIHGVIPIDYILTNQCDIVNKIGTHWNNGVLERAKEMFSEADKTCFVPVALISTKQNYIVLGDLYLRTKNKGYVNIANELERWPTFLQINKEAYFQNLSIFYTNHRRHHACNLKPVFPDTNLPHLTFESTLSEYNTICDSIPKFESKQECKSDSIGGSTVVGPNNQQTDDKAFKLNNEEIEKYSKMYIKVSGREYNVLTVLLNKAKDLKMCDKYKDLKSIGRANTFAPKG